MGQNNYFQWCKCSCHRDTPIVSYSECKALQSPDLGPPFWIPLSWSHCGVYWDATGLGERAEHLFWWLLFSHHDRLLNRYWLPQKVCLEEGQCKALLITITAQICANLVRGLQTGLHHRAVGNVRKRLHFHSRPFCYSRGNNKLSDFVKVTEEINVKIGISPSLILSP